MVSVKNRPNGLHNNSLKNFLTYKALCKNHAWYIINRLKWQIGDDVSCPNWIKGNGQQKLKQIDYDPFRTNKPPLLKKKNVIIPVS